MFLIKSPDTTANENAELRDRINQRLYCSRFGCFGLISQIALHVDVGPGDHRLKLATDNMSERALRGIAVKIVQSHKDILFSDLPSIILSFLLANAYTWQFTAPSHWTQTIPIYHRNSQDP